MRLRHTLKKIIFKIFERPKTLKVIWGKVGIKDDRTYTWKIRPGNMQELRRHSPENERHGRIAIVPVTPACGTGLAVATNRIYLKQFSRKEIY